MGLFGRKNPYEKDALDLETAMRDSPERPDLKSRQAPMPPQQQAAPQPQQPKAPLPPSQNQSNPGAPMSANQAPQATAPYAPAPAKPSYGIEDAISLMRELPDNKKEMVIAIVQKTLVSAKINVHTIIDDATRKIDRLEKKNEKLSVEIRELEEAIVQRKMEMDKNLRDVEETREVKVSFESVQPRGYEDPMQRPIMGSPMSSTLSPRPSDQPMSAPPQYLSTQKAG